jgi:membrane protein DedA with SNARE-associated domain
VPDLSDFWPVLAAFLGAIAGGLGAPIPEEAVVIGAGIWVAGFPEVGPLRWLILPVCIVGILIADVFLYFIGRTWGGRLLNKPGMVRLLPPERRRHIEDNFHRYGVKILLFVRWLPGIRSPMFMTAGLMRLPLSRFIVADAAAAAVGHTVLFFLAWWFGDRFKEMIELAEGRLRNLIIISGIFVLALLFVIHFLRKPVATADPEDVPLIGHQVAAKLEPSATVDGRLDEGSADPVPQQVEQRETR